MARDPIQVLIDIKDVSERDRALSFKVCLTVPPLPMDEFDSALDPLTRMTIDRLAFWVGQAGFVQDDLRLIGEYLYRLFPPTVRTKFDGIYGSFAAEKVRFRDGLVAEPPLLRIVLRFANDAHLLASYPWELLYYSPPKGDGFFLAGPDTELVLSRFLIRDSSWPAERLLPAANELSILVATCLPGELIPKYAEEVINKLQSLGRSCRLLSSPTEDEIKEAIGRERPHIFHFIGHGAQGKIRVAATPEQQRRTQAETGNAQRWTTIPAENVGKLCAGHHPQLVFLQSCEGATTREGFASAALSLIKEGVPSVVAMQFEIEYGDATAFAKVFYDAIGAAKTIDRAVAEGRATLGKPRAEREPPWNDRRFGAPVLFLQAAQAALVRSERLCSVCKAANNPTHKFCGSCGARITPTAPEKSNQPTTEVGKPSDAQPLAAQPTQARADDVAGSPLQPIASTSVSAPNLGGGQG